jgi:hypothetical protein
LLLTILNWVFYVGLFLFILLGERTSTKTREIWQSKIRGLVEETILFCPFLWNLWRFVCTGKYVLLHRLLDVFFWKFSFLVYRRLLNCWIQLSFGFLGVAGLYDYGPSGCAMEANMVNIWKSHFVLEEQMLEIRASLLTPHQVLKWVCHKL